MPKKPEHPERDSIAREVDRLVRQLPGADPTLQGDPDAPPPRSAELYPQASGLRPATGRAGSGPDDAKPWAVWARLVVTVALGAALTQWPYPAECGWQLYGYLAAVAVVLVAAGWTALTAWQLRIGIAHTLALVAGFWGIVLAAEQILPRIGYAADKQYWSCAALEKARAPIVPPSPAAPSAVPGPAADSAARDSASGAAPTPATGTAREN